jgi:glucosamine 6-phosphate synthetase-like amidotransferase/phosphosugar isomerase protein
VLHSVVAEDDTEVAALSTVAFRIPHCSDHLVALPYTIPLQLAAWHISHAKL